MVGITIGFPAMLAAIGLGSGSVIEAFPQIHTALKYIGGAHFLYLALLIGSADKAGEPEARDARSR
jgi:threonine/homoserine/homoserine lactone efflux protein